MIEELSKDIVTVLMKEGQVSLPALGTFSLQTAAANITLIDNQATPPSAKAEFNPNLTMDDGRLFRHLTLNRGYGEELAFEKIGQLEASITEALAEGKMVHLTGLGRVFRDHSGELRFNAGDENLSRDHFGLPNIPITPILRQEKVADPTPLNRSARTPRTTSTNPEWLTAAWLWIQRQIWYIAGATIILFLLGLWYIQQREASPTVATTDPPTSILPRERTNVSPPPPAEPSTPAPAATTPSTTTTPPAVNTPPPPPASGQTARIAVGRYGRQANVDKMVRRISEAGYTPYTQIENGLTRVGIQYEYSSDAELDRALAGIRRRFTQDAFVMDRD